MSTWLRWFTDHLSEEGMYGLWLRARKLRELMLKISTKLINFAGSIVVFARSMLVVEALEVFNEVCMVKLDRELKGQRQ